MANSMMDSRIFERIYVHFNTARKEDDFSAYLETVSNFLLSLRGKRMISICNPVHPPDALGGGCQCHEPTSQATLDEMRKAHLAKLAKEKEAGKAK